MTIPPNTFTQMGMRPRVEALGKAVLAAEQTAERTRDARHLLEAEALKRELKAELERMPGAPPPSRRPWRHS
jgi:hypothetical protein